jgi:hypothetical protein
MGDKLSFVEVLKELEKLNLDDFNLPDNVNLNFINIINKQLLAIAI